MESTFHPKAPMRGPSKEALIKILRRPDAEKQLPITLAKYSPDAIVRKEDNQWVIRILVTDGMATKKAFEKAMANNQSFMDENAWRFRYPGPILVEAATKEDFINAIEKIKWDFGEEDGRGEKPYLKHK
jgi:hypothetical protein